MAKVEMTSNLFRFFPSLANREINVPAGSVAEVLQAMDRIAPGFSHYIIDDHGALRQHVNLTINDTVVVDRKNLSEKVTDDGTLYIFQALSGG